MAEFSVDFYSSAVVPIDLAFGGSVLAKATGFVWRDGKEFFLITNWHNVTVTPRTQIDGTPRSF
ncbi:hypothetical protein [Bradyrhizobium sp.]|uniref:hypothetical protein n=1 Tax=Bradyrhizobium sp. TaxID=376 RepID=UPI003C3DBDB2